MSLLHKGKANIFDGEGGWFGSTLNEGAWGWVTQWRQRQDSNLRPLL